MKRTFSVFLAGSILVLIVLMSGCGGGDANDGKKSLLPSAVVAAGAAATDYNNVVQQLYIAYFGRPADTSGLANFEAALSAANAPTTIAGVSAAYNSNATIRGLVDAFGTSAESNALYTGGTSAFVSAVYTNIFNRTADAAGLAFWTNAIDSGALSKGNAALSIMAGALSNTTAQGLIDAAIVNNKTAVGSSFTSTLSTAQSTGYSGDAAAATARSMLATVTNTTDTSAFQATITSTIVALGYSNASLSGAYAMTNFYASSVTSNSISIMTVSIPSAPFATDLHIPIGKAGSSAESGTVTFDGAGHYTYSGTQNKDGVVTSVTASGSYSVTADGVLTIDELTGRVLSSGSTFILASTSSDPQIAIGIKTSGTFSNASLSGSYAMADFHINSVTSNSLSTVTLSIPSAPFTTNLQIPIGKKDATADFGTAIFDGAGHYTYSGTQNKDGVVTSVTASGSYSVTADGVLTIDELTGRVLSGGNTFILASTSSDPQIGIGIKTGGAFSNASLSGAYGMVNFYASSVTSNPISTVAVSIPSVPFTTDLQIPIGKAGNSAESGTVTFDGAGHYTYSGTQNKDGVVTSVTASGSYSVTADGVLTIDELTGRVLSSGNTFILASTSSDPQIAIGISK